MPRRPPTPHAVGESSLHRRDALWAAALNTAIARRSGDGGAVQKHWYAAMEVLAEYSVDLFSLLPLGELWVAAARMRQVDRLQHTLDEALALLESLGNPVLWSVPLHWAGVHAGILANSPEAVAPHGHALTSAAGGSPFAKALSGAGRTWLRVLANHVDADEVTAAARSLSQFGLTSDATRLAGQAALQTPDGRVSGAMLQLARDLKLTMAVDDGFESAPSTPWPRVHRGRSHRGCRTESARSPNCSCSGCRTAISAASCSSPRRPSSTTSRAFGAGWGRSRARRCSPCCERCWPRRADRPTSSPNAPRSPNRIPLSVTPRHRGEHRSATPTCALVSNQSFRDQTDAEV